MSPDDISSHILIPKSVFEQFLENSFKVYYTDPEKSKDSSHIQPESMHLATKISSEGVNLDKQAFNAS